MSPGFADEVIDYVDALLQDPASIPGQNEAPPAALAPAGRVEEIQPAPGPDLSAQTRGPASESESESESEPGSGFAPEPQQPLAEQAATVAPRLPRSESESDREPESASTRGPEPALAAGPPPPTTASMPAFDPAPLPVPPAAPAAPEPAPVAVPAPRPVAAAPAPLRAPAPAAATAPVSYQAQDSRWLRVMVGGDSYALELLRVQEVVRVAPIVAMRGARPAVLGVMNLRGRIVPVFDLGLWLGAGHVDADEHSRIVVVERDDELIGVLVSAVEDVVTLGRDRIEPPLPGGPAGVILGVARVGAAPTVLFDAYALYG